MKLHERLRWFGRMALMLFILASAAFLSAITAMRFAIQGREVEMPNLVGKKYTDAIAILGSKGLGIAVADHFYSNLPVDSVVRQSPPPGIRVKGRQVAHVVLSLGQQNVSIPKLDDRSLRAARLQLLTAGLQLGEVSTVYLPEGPSELIVEQNPPPGKMGASSPKVDVLVSLGPRPESYLMPDLAGQSLGEAQRRLSAAGLHPGRVSFAPQPNLAPGTVFAQQPPHGARVDESTQVDLQVAQAAPVAQSSTPSEAQPPDQAQPEGQHPTLPQAPEQPKPPGAAPR